jgi:putative phosphoesterase
MECIEFVRDPARNIISVSGNYDINAARYPAKEERFRRKWGRLRPDKLGALRDASNDLTPEARKWLLTIPSATSIEIEGARVSLSHYAPTTDKEGLFADTSDARLSQIAAETDGSFDIVIVGHTHSAFARPVGDVLFVNPGAVGRSYGYPTYAEIEVEPNSHPKARIISCRVLQL